MRKSSPQPIGDVVKDVVERLSQAKKKGPAKILSLWPRVCGKELTRHSRPKGLRGTTLQVFVDESAWLYQASLQKEKILAALQEKMGREKIQKIVFRIGDIHY